MWVRDRRIGVARALLRNLNLGSENLTRLVERWGPQLWAKKGAREDFVWAVLRWGVWQEEWEDEFTIREWLNAANEESGGRGFHKHPETFNPHPRLVRIVMLGWLAGKAGDVHILGGLWWGAAHRQAVQEGEHYTYQTWLKEAGRSLRLDADGIAHTAGELCYDCCVHFAVYSTEATLLAWAEKAGAVTWQDGKEGKLRRRDPEVGARLARFFTEVGEAAERERSASTRSRWWYYNTAEKLQGYVDAIRALHGEGRPVANILTFHNFTLLDAEGGVAVIADLYSSRDYTYHSDRILRLESAKHPAYTQPSAETADLRRAIGVVQGDPDAIGFDDAGWETWVRLCVGTSPAASSYLSGRSEAHLEAVKEGAADRWLRKLPMKALAEFDRNICAAVLIRAVKETEVADSNTLWAVIGNLIDDWQGSIDDLVTVATLDEGGAPR